MEVDREPYQEDEMGPLQVGLAPSDQLQMDQAAAQASLGPRRLPPRDPDVQQLDQAL